MSDKLEYCPKNLSTQLPLVLSTSVKCQFANMQQCFELPVCDDKENVISVPPTEEQLTITSLEARHHHIYTVAKDLFA